MCKKNIKEPVFNYMLLSRLVMDCKYYLGNGNGNNKILWAGNVRDQIAKMKELWYGFSQNEKPEWLSIEQIKQYKKDMFSKMNEK